MDPEATGVTGLSQGASGEAGGTASSVEDNNNHSRHRDMQHSGLSAASVSQLCWKPDTPGVAITGIDVYN